MKSPHHVAQGKKHPDLANFWNSGSGLHMLDLVDEGVS